MHRAYCGVTHLVNTLKILDCVLNSHTFALQRFSDNDPLPGGPQNIKRAFKGLFATTLIALELTLRICFATHWENFKWTLLEWTLQKIAFNAYCISFTWTWVPLNLCVVSTFLKGIFENAEIIMKKRSSVICCKCKFIKHSQMA